MRFSGSLLLNSNSKQQKVLFEGIQRIGSNRSWRSLVVEERKVSLRRETAAEWNQHKQQQNTETMEILWINSTTLAFLAHTLTPLALSSLLLACIIWISLLLCGNSTTKKTFAFKDNVTWDLFKMLMYTRWENSAPDKMIAPPCWDQFWCQCKHMRQIYTQVKNKSDVERFFFFLRWFSNSQD